MNGVAQHQIAFSDTMPNKAKVLTPLGEFISRPGFAVSFVLEKSGISRSWLEYLRTTKGASRPCRKQKHWPRCSK
jgi:hypothetical protein